MQYDMISKIYKIMISFHIGIYLIIHICFFSVSNNFIVSKILLEPDDRHENLDT